MTSTTSDVLRSEAEYGVKPVVPLGPTVPIFDSAVWIARTFVEVARRNEAGILADRDMEFLHDYRVGLRRVRSLLSQLRNVFAEQDRRRLRSELAEIMKHTNRLRDLDVYLGARDRYRALLPDAMQPSLELLFDMMEEERKAAFVEVSAYLRGGEYCRKIQALEGFEDLTRGPKAEAPTLDYACRLMLKRFRKVVRLGRAIDAKTPNARLHELRIECKKLRYLLEFFMPLFPMKKIKPLVKILKSLQDALGRFNDYSVQHASLVVFVAQHPLQGGKGARMKESVGALGKVLGRLQTQVRGEIFDYIETFVNKKTRKQFEQLFGGTA